LLEARGRRGLATPRLGRLLLERALECVQVGDEIGVERAIAEGAVPEVRGERLKNEREAER